MRILIVEDERALAEAAALRLKKENYAVEIALDGEKGLDEALSGGYDLIVLDWMLPGMSGLDILKSIRENKIETKVILLTAKAHIEDKLEGFGAGADDYMTKPFHLDELAARVNVQLRKDAGRVVRDYVEAGDVRLLISRSRVQNKTTGEEIDISGKEFQILEYLLKNAGQIVSRDQIYNRVWGYDNDLESNNLEVYLSFIRRKFRAIGIQSKIKAVRGLGYRLEAPE